jgi:hypothetical protein
MTFSKHEGLVYIPSLARVTYLIFPIKPTYVPQWETDPISMSSATQFHTQQGLTLTIFTNLSILIGFSCPKAGNTCLNYFD